MEARIKEIINTVPAPILAQNLEVSERIVYCWKKWATNDTEDKDKIRTPTEKNQRRILKLYELSKRIKNGSFEGFTETSPGNPILLNKRDFQLSLTNKYQDTVYFGDYHDGAANCDEKLGMETLEYCCKYNIPVHLMGDIGEFAMPGSPGTALFTQKFVQKQIDSIEAKVRPLAEKKLILGYTEGNHEIRIMRKTGVNICYMICRMLDIPYLGGACWNQYKVGGENYYIYTIHGRSSAQFTWTKLAYFVRLSHNFHCDAVIGAHVHELANTKIRIQTPTHRGIQEHIKHVITCGSYLKYDRSYAQNAGMNIPELGSPKVRFYADEHKISVHDVFHGKEKRPTEWVEKEE